MIATTIEQAEDLVKAGVSPDTADMCWGNISYGKGKMMIGVISKHPDLDIKNTIAPAWSISALWDILHSLDKTYEFPTTFSADELIAQLVMILCIKFKMG